MFRYTTITILFLLICFALIIEMQRGNLSFWWLVLPLFLYLIFLIIGSIKIGLGFYFKSLCKVKTTEKIVAITFDDGPHEQVTKELIELLQKHKVPATFFCIGYNISKNKALLKKMAANGHIIGNHSYTHHRWFDLYSSKKMVAEIEATSKEIERSIGKYPILFRPPYGVTNPMLKKAVEKTGMISIGWSLRSFDTIKSVNKTFEKLKNKTKPGSVVLLHDNDLKIIPIVEEYLKWLEENNYKVVSLADLFNIEAYEAE